MIPWVKYDPENPPAGGRYIVSDGKTWCEAFFFSKELTGAGEYWGLSGVSAIDHENVIHYAPINLPREE